MANNCFSIRQVDEDEEKASGRGSPASAPPSAPASASSVSSLASVVDCGVYISGVRHCGKGVVVVDLDTVDRRAPPSGELAQLLRYYRTVPRKSATKNGMVFLICGSPSRSALGFQLIQQAIQQHQVPLICIIDH